MTNQQSLALLTAEEFYDKIIWLYHEYGKSFTDSRTSIVDWLKQKANQENNLSVSVSAMGEISKDFEIPVEFADIPAQCDVTSSAWNEDQIEHYKAFEEWCEEQLRTYCGLEWLDGEISIAL